MDFLAQYGIFLLKSFTIVFAIIFLFAGIFTVTRKPKPKILITHLNKDYEDLQAKIHKEIGHKKSKKDKKNKKIDKDKPKLYVINFEGDIKAS